MTIRESLDDDSPWICKGLVSTNSTWKVCVLVPVVAVAGHHELGGCWWFWRWEARERPVEPLPPGGSGDTSLLPFLASGKLPSQLASLLHLKVSSMAPLPLPVAPIPSPRPLL